MNVPSETSRADLPGGPQTLDPELRRALRRAARATRLLVASDYDGTLAPLVEDFTHAVPVPEAVAAVRSLAALRDTTVAVISGRALRDLAVLSRLPSEIHLVGSHGSEYDPGFLDQLPPPERHLRERLIDELTALTRSHPNVRLEIKPASVAVHLRAAAPEVADRVREELAGTVMTWPGVQVTRGKLVVELSVIQTDKGEALQRLRTQYAADVVVYLGDDVTDERAFATLGGNDIGIRVGAGDTAARYRVGEPVAATRVLALLADLRREWLHGAQAVRIERHSMIGNGRALALLTPDARVTWLCHPRPDSGAIFADLLGGPPAGHFSIRPANGAALLEQRYRPGTMTVETRWAGLTVADWFDVNPIVTADRPPEPTLTNALVRVLTGTVRVRVEFAPRPEFGRVPISLQPLGDGLLVLGSSEPIVVYSPGVSWEVVEDGGMQSAVASIDVGAAGGQVVLELRLGSDSIRPHVRTLAERERSTEQWWRSWVGGLRLPQRATDAVRRSALALKALCYQPSGAILAAATTSLPEGIGGQRNWDYRYCWLRDGAMTALALVRLGSAEEGDALLDWLDRVIARTGGHPERLHPLYTIDGTELPPEAVIEILPGYAGSRPVRVGNAANAQVQLDVFGPVADLIVALAKLRGPREHDMSLMSDMAAAVARRWYEPDHGIWEARIPPRHHVYSKVMCWLTIDRARELAGMLGRPVPEEWEVLRDEIARNVLELGWHKEVEAYTVAYGHPDMDASSLWIGLSGLLADDDERFLKTVLRIESELREGPTIYRYRWEDFIPGQSKEGGFHLCTAWMIEAYLRTGRRADADELFKQLVECAGPTGLLPEQYDPKTELGLGNHPQAYSHLGLIMCALELERVQG